MAKVSAVAFKAAMATAAADLTTALQDDTLTELANEYKDALHPARNLSKLFILNKTTGVYTANDDYVDSFYAGNFPHQGTLVDGQGTTTPITLVSADIEIAAPADIVLVFSAPMSDVQTNFFTIGGAAGELKKITGISYDGAEVTITMDSAFIAADVAEVSARVFGNRNNYIDLLDEAVTNNIV